MDGFRAIFFFGATNCRHSRSHHHNRENMPLSAILDPSYRRPRLPHRHPHPHPRTNTGPSQQSIGPISIKARMLCFPLDLFCSFTQKLIPLGGGSTARRAAGKHRAIHGSLVGQKLDSYWPPFFPQFPFLTLLHSLCFWLCPIVIASERVGLWYDMDIETLKKTAFLISGMYLKRFSFFQGCAFGACFLPSFW